MRAALVPAVVAAAVVAGCAAPAEPATGPALLADVVETLRDDGSFGVQGNTAYGDGYDAHVQDGAAVGTVGMGADHDAPFVVVDGRGYLLPPDNFWPEAGASEEEALWLRGPYVDMAEDLDLPRSVDDVVVRFLPAPDEVADEIGRAELDGSPVLVMTADDGTELSVAAEAPHRPVQLVLPADEEAMAYERVLRFGDFGEHRPVRAPENPVTQDEIGG
jgi:hypothetical protein